MLFRIPFYRHTRRTATTVLLQLNAITAMLLLKKRNIIIAIALRDRIADRNGSADPPTDTVACFSYVYFWIANSHFPPHSARLLYYLFSYQIVRSSCKRWVGLHNFAKLLDSHHAKYAYVLWILQKNIGRREVICKHASVLIIIQLFIHFFFILLSTKIIKSHEIFQNPVEIEGNVKRSACSIVN